MLDETTLSDATQPERSLLRRAAGALVVRLAWLVAAVAIALGSAGIVAAAQHYPVPVARPELTWGADQARLRDLDAALDELRALNLDVVGLGDQARQARAALQQVDQVKLDAAISTGSAEIASIGTRVASVGKTLHCADSAFAAQIETANSARIVGLFEQGCAALQIAQSLGDDWVSLVDGSRSAMQTIEPITQHDLVAGQAVQLGSQGKYKDALARLDQTAQYLTSVQRSYDVLSQITDVWTLGQWLQRSKDMDLALRNLWQAMLDSNGRVTQKVRDALQAVDKAKAALPPDTRYMSVVLQEIGTAGINQAAISIETARGRLTSAVQGIAAASE